MYLTDLALNDVRSYESALVSLRPGVTVFVGENGQGKTNIVEAIAYLATLSSHRISSDNALIRQGATAGVIRARVMRGDHPSTVEVEIYAGRANRARLNRAPVRPSGVLGTIRVVLFAPEDLELVRGDPSARRRYLDSIAIQLRPMMANILAEYEKVLRQRAALLKSAKTQRRRGGSVDHGAIDVWDEQLARLGAQITAARARIISTLRPYVDSAYHLVSGGRSSARIDYLASATRDFFTLPSPLTLVTSSGNEDNSTNVALKHPITSTSSGNEDDVSAMSPASQSDPAESVAQNENRLTDSSWVEAHLREVLSTRRDEEIERGVNLVGPHRDDLVLSLGSLPAKGFASHGESWSYALALRLGSWELMRADDSGEWAGDGEPILILDDVFAELDSRRRERLAEIVARADQVFVTAAVGSEVPTNLVGARFRVHGGLVEEVLEQEDNGKEATSMPLADKAEEVQHS